jgi:hypothetical protein
MKIARTLAILLPFALAACTAEAPPKEGGAAPAAEAGTETADVQDSGKKTDKGTVYGEPIGEAPLVAVPELVANTDAYAGKRVRVTGLITGVCAKRGCWMTVGLEEGPEEVTFKVTDGVIVFPMSAQGKWTEAEGTVQKVELDLEGTRKFLAHKAEEGGEEFDPTTVTEPMTLVRLAGIGAVVTDERPPVAATSE